MHNLVFNLITQKIVILIIINTFFYDFALNNCTAIDSYSISIMFWKQTMSNDIILVI